MLGIAEFCDWLSQTPSSLFIQTTVWIIPTVQTIHILAIGVVISSVALLDFKLSGLQRLHDQVAGVTTRFVPWIWGGTIVLAFSGLILIWAEPARELKNFTFWLKMSLLVAGLLMTLVQTRLVGSGSMQGLAPSRRQLVRALAVLSLACFVGILVCGRLIAYTTDIDG